MWLIERDVFPNDEEERLVRTLSELHIPFDEVLGVDLRSCIPRISKHDVVRGSCWLISQANQTDGWRKDIWGCSTDFSYSHYASRYRELLLNYPYVATTFHELCWARQNILQENPDSFFVRPDDGFKSIEGQVIRLDQFDQWVDRCRLLQIRGSAPLIVASSRQILTEWRCVVIDGQFIASSEYKPSFRSGSPPQVQQFVLKVQNSVPGPCRAYVMDVAETPDGLRVVEIGCICCVAFYEADAHKIVERLTAM